MKRFARIICAVVVFMLIAACALATTEEEYQARIAELEARVAELEHELAVKGYVAEFDGGYVLVEDAMKQYEYIAYMYQQYGYSMTGYEDYIKQDIAEDLARDAVAQYKAAELGIDRFEDVELEKFNADAEAELAGYVDSYRYLFEEDGKDEETVTEETVAYLADGGVTVETLVAEAKKQAVMQAVYEYCVKDVELTEEELIAGYGELVAADIAAYSGGGGSFEQALMSGNTVYYTPEGYRNVKNLLVKFNDEQTTRYKDITGRISDLEDELAAAPDSEGARSEEDIKADLESANAELDELYAELDDDVTELMTMLDNGTDIDSLIAARGGDPGSVNADGTVNTYAVSANSSSYDPAFTDAAMSIEEIGGISEPARGSYGVYILCYDSDMESGEIGLENVREELSASLLDEKRDNTYNETLDGWCDELNLVYYLENFK